jgi:glutamine amidotransferase-like uncharacterized protein
MGRIAETYDEMIASHTKDQNMSPWKFGQICLAVAAVLLLAFQVAAAASTDSDTKIRIALYADDGAAKEGSPQVKKALPVDKGFVITTVTAEEIRNGALDNVDVLIHPGGSGSKQAKTLGDEGRDRVKKFVAEGGGFIGICAGAYLASANYPWSLGLLDAKVVDSAHWARGNGQVQLTITPAGLAALGAGEEHCPIYYGQGPLLAPGEKDDIDDYELLATYDTEIAKNGAPKGIMKGTTAVARGKFGKGRVLCFSPHPEKTPGREPFLQAAVRWAAKADGAGSTSTISPDEPQRGDRK